ncbi:MAG: hypothetical protein WCB27_21950 [Thermoguttaceae bacterium]|jgi:hypothetical protein
MNKVVGVVLCGMLLLEGCSQGTTDIAASASFDALKNRNLSGRVVPVGDLDKKVVVEGIPDSDFRVVMEVSCKNGDANASSGAEMLFRWKDNRLDVLPEDCRLSGGGERPAVRRENDREFTVYYPVELRGKRSWAKFHVIVDTDQGRKSRPVP